MPDITDPRAAKFGDRVVRPMSETMRQLYEDAKRARTRWQDEISSLIADTALDTLIDGRTAEGISILDGAEINAIARDLNAYITWYEARSGIDSRLAKASVRTLRS